MTPVNLHVATVAAPCAAPRHRRPPMPFAALLSAPSLWLLSSTRRSRSACPETTAFVTVHGFPRRIKIRRFRRCRRSCCRFLLPLPCRPTKHDAAETMVKTACQTVLKWRRWTVGRVIGELMSNRRIFVGQWTPSKTAESRESNPRVEIFGFDPC